MQQVRASIAMGRGDDGLADRIRSGTSDTSLSDDALCATCLRSRASVFFRRKRNEFRVLGKVGVTEFAVAYAAKQHAIAQQNIDRQLAGLAVEGIAQMFREGYWMVIALKAQVLATPHVPDLRKLFNQTAAELIARGPGPSIGLALLPMGRLTMFYPSNAASANTIGLDFMQTPFGRDPR
ncbi:hypothetical protein HaLaN_17118 [Haematococcus lacustris]|uniref:Uncharacterized protein n=1 Tax=Haematococcus lacustris TaxID=44745 RepID=A0A699ZKD7_HAELA|nr:hypothetical protein HaLaN_17118 [Haematococcus lacustris]